MKLKSNSLKIISSMFKNVVFDGIRKNKPSFFFKLVKGYLEVRLAKKQRVQYLEIMTTHACNVRCNHCSNAHYDNRLRKDMLTPEKVEDLIRQAAAMCIPAVVFLGGEPMLDPNIFRYVKSVYEKGMMATLGSNGQLFTSENLTRLKEAHISKIGITIYSTNPEENEQITKLPNYLENAINSIKLGKSLGISMQLKTVVNKKHFESGEIYRIVDLARNLGVWLSINPMVPTGAAYDNYKDDTLDEKLQGELDRLVYENNFITTHLTSNYFGYGCPAGRAYLGVSAFGDVIPCFFIPISYGSVWDESLAVIHERILKTNLFGEGAKTCVAAYDRKFIDMVIAPCFSSNISNGKIPVNVNKHPLFNVSNDRLDI